MARPAAIIAAAVAATPALRRERTLQPLGQVLAVIAPHHFVADAIGQLTDPRLQRGAPLRRREGAALDFARPDNIGEPARSPDHFLDGAAPARAREIVGVLTFRQQRETQTLAGLEMRQRQ